MENVNERKEKQRKIILLLAPLIFVPFLALIFWALGGGKKADGAAGNRLVKSGLKFELPNASLEDRAMDKLSYYDRAKNDSIKRLEALRNDPYYVKDKDSGKSTFDYSKEFGLTLGNKGFGRTTPITDANEAKVYERLSSLQTLLNDQQQSNKPEALNAMTRQAQGLERADIDRLERLLEMTKNNQANNEADTETQELNSMLDKVLDIQYPERVKERVKKKSQETKGKIFTVSANNSVTPISSLEVKKGEKATTGFYSLDDAKETLNESQNTISAVVHETQTVVSGGIVKLRLTSDIYIDGILIPKDHFVFGIASLQGERLAITIEKIAYKEYLFPVSLAVFGIDGIFGVHIPGAISRDVAKQSTSGAIEGINSSATTIDPSLSMQAATAGLEFGKSLLTKKIKLIKVTIKSGYRVQLKDLNDTNSK